MCVYCPEGDVVKIRKKIDNTQSWKLPWAKGRCWVRARTGREDRKKGGRAWERKK